MASVYYQDGEERDERLKVDEVGKMLKHGCDVEGQREHCWKRGRGKGGGIVTRRRVTRMDVPLQESAYEETRQWHASWKGCHSGHRSRCWSP